MELILQIIVVIVVIWVIIKIFSTSYLDKLKKIPGVGDSTAELIKNNYPTEKELRNASAEEISAKVSGVGKGTAEKIKSKFK